jgi:MFS family permease
VRWAAVRDRAIRAVSMTSSPADAAVRGRPAGRPRGVRDRLLVPSLGACLLVATTAFLVIFTLQAQISASLHASRTAVSWLAIATLLAGTVGTALLPALGSVVGQRLLLTGAMACLAAGSLVSAAAPDVQVLIAGRAVASLGLAAAVLSLAVLREHRSGRALASALAVMAAVDGAAGGTGFVLGGVAEELAHADWRAAFGAIAALAAAAGAVAAFAVPGGGSRAVRRFDVAGAVLLVAGLVAALVPLTEGSNWGWTSGRVVALFVIAALLLALWAVAELRLTDPLLQLDVLRRRGVAAGAVLFFVTAGTVGVVNLTIPSFLQAPPGAGYGAGASVLTSGLYMLPAAAAITVSAGLTGRLLRRVPPRHCAAASLLAETVAFGLLAGFHHGTAPVVLLVALFGAGHGGAVACEFVLITASAQPAEAGTAVSLGGALSGIGGAVATAAITPILLTAVVRLGPVTLPAAASYAGTWLFAAALAAAGAVTAWLAGGARPSGG